MERSIESIGKRLKVSDDDRNLDRLSDLPDGVICHILSFLPTRRSLQTSVLAKRWRSLWAHVPLIDLFNPNSEYEDCEGEEDSTSYTTTAFSKIACTVILRHKVQSLNSFRLKCPDYDDNDYGPLSCYELETCIATVVERNVQNLHLDLRVEVPRCLLTCKTLVDLTMKSVIIPRNAPIYLPNLKKLCLEFLEAEDVDFTRLLSGFPVLEELYIEGTKCRDPRGCYISSPTLKDLTIMYLLDTDMFHNPDYMLTINTPALRSIEIFPSSSKHISISLCSSLVEANINIGSLGEPDDFYHRLVLKLLDSIRTVKYLNFNITGSCGKICDVLVLGPIAKFGNLTELRYCANWCFLSKFLESADHLQKLSISCEDGYSEHWMEPIEGRCACLLYSLRIVSIDDFRFEEQSFNMVRYILRNALVLERMEIDCRRWTGRVGLKERFDAIQRIALFRRGSAECELAFS